jgi:hypothetical protein
MQRVSAKRGLGARWHLEFPDLVTARWRMTALGWATV